MAFEGLAAGHSQQESLASTVERSLTRSTSLTGHKALALGAYLPNGYQISRILSESPFVVEDSSGHLHVSSTLADSPHAAFVGCDRPATRHHNQRIQQGKVRADVLQEWSLRVRQVGDRENGPEEDHNALVAIRLSKENMLLLICREAELLSVETRTSLSQQDVNGFLEYPPGRAHESKSAIVSEPEQAEFAAAAIIEEAVAVLSFFVKEGNLTIPEASLFRLDALEVATPRYSTQNQDMFAPSALASEAATVGPSPLGSRAPSTGFGRKRLLSQNQIVPKFVCPGPYYHPLFSGLQEGLDDVEREGAHRPVHPTPGLLSPVATVESVEEMGKKFSMASITRQESATQELRFSHDASRELDALAVLEPPDPLQAIASEGSILSAKGRDEARACRGSSAADSKPGRQMSILRMLLPCCAPQVADFPRPVSVTSEVGFADSFKASL